jgi:Mg-chelatase subunit ChlD
MEEDVRELAQQVELWYQRRCDPYLMQTCAFAFYDHCASELPNPTCHGGENLNRLICGDSDHCNSLFDYTSVSTFIPLELSTGPNSNPQDPHVIESICAMQGLDTYLQEKRASDSAYWAALGEEPRSTYFGSISGSFLIYPAIPADECGEFNPTKRPWYIAASSGPKNVVLILDISGSMNGLPFEQTKQAAIQIINTLTTRDTVNIVVFHSNASLIDSSLPYLVQATEENKASLNNSIQELVLGAQTNFYDAFETAFDMLEMSVTQEKQACANSQSNTAILFLTDGKANVPSSDTAPVVELVNERIANLTDQLNIALFTYSIAGKEAEVDAFPSQLACAVEHGIWSKISTESDIVQSLSSYYKLFALGLADANYTAWVEPYLFKLGGILGITVSTPVYDRSVEPPEFFGVVAKDFGLTALINALGGTAADFEQVKDESLRLLALRSTSICPILAFDECALESYRRRSGSNCSDKCDGSIAPYNSLCTNVVLPTYLWNNTENVDQSYGERACCSADKTKNLCPIPSQAPVTVSPATLVLASTPSIESPTLALHPNTTFNGAPSSNTIFVPSQPDNVIIKGRGMRVGIIAGAVTVPLAILGAVMVLLVKRRNKGLIQPRLY